MDNTTNVIRVELAELSNPQIAEHSQRFFKTGKGQYGEGDRFLGIRVPTLRRLAERHSHVTVGDASSLLESEFHEERLLALFLLVALYKKSTQPLKEQIHRLYLAKTRFVNNWDLVDSSAEHIVGAHLWDGGRSLLYKLAESDSLWERRIAIISTFHFIKRDQFTDTLKIAEILVHDKEDLIHKAVGWMLREVGKRDLELEEDFLRRHCAGMPRVMLRYAIEKFAEDKRQEYLAVGRAQRTPKGI